MAYICPATGHSVISGRGPTVPPAPFCPDHGVRIFQNCRTCNARWPTTWAGYHDPNGRGSDFCDQCGLPAPWLSREDRIDWLRNQIQTDPKVPPETRYELEDVLARLKAMTPDDTKAVPGWEQIRKAVPKVWEVAKPVLADTIGAEVRKYLGL